MQEALKRLLKQYQPNSNSSGRNGDASDVSVVGTGSGTLHSGGDPDTDPDSDPDSLADVREELDTMIRILTESSHSNKTNVNSAGSGNGGSNGSNGEYNVGEFFGNENEISDTTVSTTNTSSTSRSGSQPSLKKSKPSKSSKFDEKAIEELIQYHQLRQNTNRYKIKADNEKDKDMNK